MYESESFGVQGLTRAYFETILHELHIFRCGYPSQDFVSAIARVIEKRMAYVFHMYAYLMGASGFQPAFHHGHMRKVVDYFIVGDSVFAVIAVGKDGHLQSVFETSPYVSFDCTAFFVELSPYNRYILSVGCLIEELFANYDGTYEKETIDWGDPAGKEIW